MRNTVALVVLALVAPACGIFGGAADTTLELQAPPASGPVDVQLVDSSVEPGEVYLKLVVHNRSDRKLVVDRRALVLSDGRTQWRARATSKPLVTVKPNATSSKIKLVFEGVPAGLPVYELGYGEGAFRQDGETGTEIRIPPARLVVKKAEVTAPEPTAPSGAQDGNG